MTGKGHWCQRNLFGTFMIFFTKMLSVKKLWFLILLLITGCKKDNELLSIAKFVPKQQYYEQEIFEQQNQAIYGKWKYLYKTGGIGGITYGPEYDYLEVIKYGIYGIIDDHNIKEMGKIVIDRQDNQGILIQFIPDKEYWTKYFYIDKWVGFQGDDTLTLCDNMADGYIDYYKRVK